MGLGSNESCIRSYMYFTEKFNVRYVVEYEDCYRDFHKCEIVMFHAISNAYTVVMLSSYTTDMHTL